MLSRYRFRVNFEVRTPMRMATLPSSAAWLNRAQHTSMPLVSNSLRAPIHRWPRPPPPLESEHDGPVAGRFDRCLGAQTSGASCTSMIGWGRVAAERPDHPAAALFIVKKALRLSEPIMDLRSKLEQGISVRPISSRPPRSDRTGKLLTDHFPLVDLADRLGHRIQH